MQLGGPSAVAVNLYAYVYDNIVDNATTLFNAYQGGPTATLSPGTKYVPLDLDGRFLGLFFETQGTIGNNWWELYSYDLEIAPLGEF